jgi:glycosyltransferase involved in cell wall biosynthesis
MDLPKPVHGMANVNLAILEYTRKLNIEPQVINTVPSYAARFFTSKLWTPFKIVHTFLCCLRLLIALFFNIKGVVYRPINGGNGQVYDLIYISLCKIFGCKIYIHHHSFNYLNSKKTVFSMLNKLAGESTIHVVLGERMAVLLNELYGINKNNIKVVSNLAFFEALPSNLKNINNEVIKIGHLANLCIEKGVDVFIDVCRELYNSGVNFTAEIAGPCVDDKSKIMVTNAVNELPPLKYLGPVYSKDKDSFYHDLDCFVFPSKYSNEAEPLVLYEAALNGVYLIGTRRGCMADVIKGLNGFSCDVTPNTIEEISKEIKSQLNGGGFNFESKVERLNLFKQGQTKSKESLLQLLNDMARI